jgi:hypothetical protein
MERLAYALTQPWEVVARSGRGVRHLMPEGRRDVTLCGRRVREVCDYTPLIFDCKACAVQARTHDARRHA